MMAATVGPARDGVRCAQGPDSVVFVSFFMNLRT